MSARTHDLLVVADEPTILGAWRHLLPAYRMHYARDGLEAVALHEQLCADGRPVAVAFVDLPMPAGSDGIETITRLWRTQPDLEVVLCTAHTDDSWHAILDRLDKRERVVILRKPCDPIEVRQLAACVSEKWSRGRALAERMEELEVQIKHEVSRRLELQLRDLQKFEELGRLAAGIAHEINSPLQYIQFSLGLLAESIADLHEHLAQPEPDLAAARALLVDAPATLEDAETGVRRVTSIVRSVREIAHTRREAAAELVEINAQIELVAELVRVQYKHALDVVLDLGPSPLTVVGDADELSRALLNIAVNAAQAIESTRHGGPRGRIVIRSRAVADTIVVEIEDTGKGIPREHWDHIFEPFFTTKPRGQGTGQGLAMARAAIVELHRGSLTFDTELGLGTTFTITLARRKRTSPTAAPPLVGSAA